LIPC